jgi:hypothetical protein
MGAIAAVGLAVAAGSRMLQGAAQSNESKAVAEAYKTNAEMALKQAENRAAQERDKYRRLAASQRAAYGASGIEVNEGSPLDVLADTDAEGVVSAMQLLYGGDLEAANWRQQAKAAKSSGRSSMLDGILGGASIGLAGGSKFMGG